MFNLARSLDRNADRTPDEAAVIFRDTRLTHRQLLDRVNALAAAFRAAGVGQGDIVALLMGNRPEFLESALAVNRVGAAFLPLNVRLAEPELEYIIRHAGATAIVTEPGLAGPVAAIGGRLTTPWTVVVAGEGEGATTAGVAVRVVPRRAPRRLRSSGRRHRGGPAPAHVQLGDDRAPQGGADQLRELLLEDDRARRGVRPQRGRPHADGGADVPRGSVRPARHRHLVGRRQPGDPAPLRRARPARRDRAGTADQRLAGPGDGERDAERDRPVSRARPAQHREHPVHHRGRGEDAGDAHRAAAGGVPQRAVRRRLRADRDRVRRHVQRPGAHAVEDRLGRQAGGQPGRADPRPGRRPGRAGRPGRDRAARAQGGLRLLEEPRRHGGRVHRRRLVPDRGHRPPRRGRLPLHRRPQEGHDRLRRRERRDVGGGARPVRVRRGARGGRGRHARRALGRGAAGLRRARARPARSPSRR